MKQFGFYFDQTRCIGCHTCSVSCKDWHDIPAGEENWIRIKSIEEGKFPNLYLTYLFIDCNHCTDPPCVKACPVGAIFKRKSDGIVIVDRNKCLGKNECGSKCLKVCIWGAPQFNSEENAKMRKCELCVDRLEQNRKPICVEACPMYALDVGVMEELHKKYGTNINAEGFPYSEKIKPSVIFRPKWRK